MSTRTYFAKLASPIGELVALSNGRALTGLFTDAEQAPADTGSFVEDRTAFHELEQQLAAYFGGMRRDFELPLALRGTAFQMRVWRALCGIAYGTTTTYAEIASRIGQPAAARAVGAANAKNPLAILVPCHRVIGSDGSPVGYAGGLARKRWLLTHERRASQARA
jgi:methylated-DNA-[protein]-cysteine S-methyltransferase